MMIGKALFLVIVIYRLELYIKKNSKFQHEKIAKRIFSRTANDFGLLSVTVVDANA